MQRTTLRIGGYQPPSSVHTRAVYRLATTLADSHSAHFETEVIPDVTERGLRAADLLTMVEEGTIDICYFSSSYLVGRVASLGWLERPFAVTDRRHVYRELAGSLGTRLAEDVATSTGFRLLGFWDNGFRHITNRLRPIRHPDDCRGMRIRTLDNALHQKLFAAIGFTPVAIDVKDLVRAVETGEVDAQENPLTNTVNFGIHRTHRHVSLTSHFFGIALLLANRAWLDGLSPTMQSALSTATSEATTAQRQFAVAEDIRCLELLARDGVELVPAEKIDLPAFQAATGGLAG